MNGSQDVATGVGYVEQPPLPVLAGVVRTVWVQHTGARGYTQRDLPTGGVELQCPLDGAPQLLGPLTRARVQVLPPHVTVVGVRFWPGAAVPLFKLPIDELVDVVVPLYELWGATASRLGERLADAPSPQQALEELQRCLIDRQARAARADRLVRVAVRRLMPWQPVKIEGLSRELMISESQLRRRLLVTVGVGPKTLQRTLRFQGFLALAQAAAGTGQGTVAEVADLAAEAGYADHAHLSRECRRLSGLTPTALLGVRSGRCGCGHDHAASYQPFLALRPSSIGVG